MARITIHHRGLNKITLSSRFNLPDHDVEDTLRKINDTVVGGGLYVIKSDAAHVSSVILGRNIEHIEVIY